MNNIELGCGFATPEGYDNTNREALHVLNVKLVGDANRDRVLKFTCARIRHFARHLPQGTSQRIRFDLRGQMIKNEKLEHVRQVIAQESKKHGVQVVVEFLTN